MSNLYESKFQNLKVRALALLKKSWKYLKENKVRVLCLGLGLAILVPLTLFILVRFTSLGALPSLSEIRRMQNPESSTIFDSRGENIGSYFIEDRINIKLNQINPYILEALLATEDIRFYSHSGVDLRSMGRVFFKTLLLQRSSSGGGSTITQQLSKNVYGRKRYKVVGAILNKIREMVIARRIERVYSKKEILTLYLNTVSFGERAFGIHTAAGRFFNKTPKDLNQQEASTLIGMLKAPSYYSPRRFPERAEYRRNVVFGQMMKYGFLEQSKYDSLRKIPLEINYNNTKGNAGFASYFKQQVLRDFDEWSREHPKPDGTYYSLKTDGLKVHTTLNADLQRSAESRLSAQLEKLQNLFSEEWKKGKPLGKGSKVIDDAIMGTSLYKSLRANGANSKEALSHFTKKGQRKVWTWKGSKEKEMTRIDSLKHYLMTLHGSAAGIDPMTGAVQCWVGGNDYFTFPYDHVRTPRQVGSTFKPIVYLAALESGIKPCEFFDNELRNYVDFKDWTPKNANGEYGGSYSMHGALAHSVNTVSVQIMMRVGAAKVVELAKRLGIKSSIPEVPSLVLGTADISLLDMLTAYGVIANGGLGLDPYTIEKITDTDDRLLFQHEVPERVDTTLSSEEVKTITSMLSRVMQYGTGRRINSWENLPVEIIGKTGTTQNQSDGWFIGASPNLVLGSWVGTLDRRIHFKNLSSGSGSNTALPIVANIFNDAYRKKLIEPRSFNIEPLAIDCPTYSDLSAIDMNRLNEQKSKREEDPIVGFFERLFGRKKSKKKRQRRRY